MSYWVFFDVFYLLITRCWNNSGCGMIGLGLVIKTRLYGFIKKSKMGLLKKRLTTFWCFGVPVLIKKIKVFTQKEVGPTFVL